MNQLKYCIYCGKALMADDMFCQECGQKQTESEKELNTNTILKAVLASMPKKLVCKSCGAPLQEGDLFCQVCGTKQ